ncbi:nucleotidyl transferase AbiEii/AbiGii toxin family protein [Nocardia sp. NPDC050712]|uniref:nucleotidyl transferase AbiEii/AbiGii toxin family protein n=1 Tax=Nocardia sp. NPDC050712 TaxID=3155518 RepID=UPI0033CF9FC2
MTTSWEKFPYGPWKATTVVPQTPPPESSRIPPSVRPVSGDGVRQRPVFDPSLQHYALGMRLSEPEFVDPGLAERWLAARRDAVDLILAAIADSPWSQHLMLRGSVLLRAWFGEMAREPGDIDFVVVPTEWRVDDDRAARMLDDIAERAQATAENTAVRIHADGRAETDIWTYDRVPGRRLVLPWSSTTPGVPAGSIQLDFVFNEALPVEPVHAEVARVGRPGPPAHLLTAGLELSLAWKLQWLSTDIYPQGKDLFDALLLAEHCHLPADLLRGVLEPHGDWTSHVWGALPYVAATTDWDEFGKDYPHLAGELDVFTWRLMTALAPSFDAGFHRLPAEMLASGNYSRIEDVAAAYAQTGAAAVLAAFSRRGLCTLELVVLLRELLGPASSFADAATLPTNLREQGFTTAVPARVDPGTVAAALEGSSR